MRDINRIRTFCNELADIWEKECPDWRFNQLVLNIINSELMEYALPFYVEDEKMMEYIREFFRKEK
jgi:hypothetical protein